MPAVHCQRDLESGKKYSLMWVVDPRFGEKPRICIFDPTHENDKFIISGWGYEWLLKFCIPNPHMVNRAYVTKGGDCVARIVFTISKREFFQAMSLLTREFYRSTDGE